MATAQVGVTSAVATIGTGAAAGAATGGPIGAAVGAAVSAIKVGITALTQHTQRMTDAKNENAALNQVVPAFDADLKAVNEAYNEGSASAQECISALQQIGAKVYQYLQAQVGKPGTAWSATVGMAGQCNKECTAGCCNWYSVFGPAISDSSVAIGGPQIGGGWGSGDPRLQKTASGGIVQVQTVYGSSFGGQTRQGYTLTWSAPTVAKSLTTSILDLVDGGSQVALAPQSTSLSSVGAGLNQKTSPAGTPATGGSVISIVLIAAAAIALIFVGILASK